MENMLTRSVTTRPGFIRVLGWPISLVSSSRRNYRLSLFCALVRRKIYSELPYRFNITKFSLLFSLPLSSLPESQSQPQIAAQPLTSPPISGLRINRKQSCSLASFLTFLCPKRHRPRSIQSHLAITMKHIRGETLITDKHTTPLGFYHIHILQTKYSSVDSSQTFNWHLNALCLCHASYALINDNSFSQSIPYVSSFASYLQ